MPNFRGTRFTNAHETLLWCTTSREAKYTFNYQNLKELNEGKQMRSDWYIPICSGKERLRKDNNQRSHPTQKPEALLYRILLASTNKGDLVLDPFSGSGTTAVVAKKLQRNFIGIEKDKDYVKLSKERLKNTKVLKEEVGTIAKSRKELPKVPFGELVEQGIIPPGAVLTDKKELETNIFVKVRSTGKLLEAKVNLSDQNGADVELKKPEDGISPGQACVFYNKDKLGYKVLGGGWIT